MLLARWQCSHDRESLASIRDRSGIVALPSSLSCRQDQLPPMVMRRKRILRWRELEYECSGIYAPGSGNGFALGGGPIVGGWLLFQSHGNLEGKRS